MWGSITVIVTRVQQREWHETWSLISLRNIARILVSNGKGMAWLERLRVQLSGRAL